MSSQVGGSVAMVTPTGWLYLRRYDAFRRALLQTGLEHVLRVLGKGAFEAISGQPSRAFCWSSSATHSDGDAIQCIDARVLVKR